MYYNSQYLFIDKENKTRFLILNIAVEVKKKIFAQKIRQNYDPNRTFP